MSLFKPRRPTGAYKRASDLSLYNALAPTHGLNPVIKQGKVVRIRCGFCGTLLTVAEKDWNGEFEVKCPACKQVSVFGHRPLRWGTPHEHSELERMLINIQEGR